MKKLDSVNRVKTVNQKIEINVYCAKCKAQKNFRNINEITMLEGIYKVLAECKTCKSKITITLPYHGDKLVTVKIVKDTK